MKITKSGYDPRTATERDAFLFSTDYHSDQIISYGIALFPGTSDTTSVPLPSLYGEYKIDYFYWLSIDGGAYGWPEHTRILTNGSFANFSEVTQLMAEFSGGEVVFTRRGSIAGNGNSGVQYWLYTSGQP